MHRRFLIAALACWPAAHLLAQDETRPRHKISAAQLHKALSASFPVRFGFGGLLELEVSAPRLLLLPPRNQVGATLVAQAGGPALQPLAPGEVDLMFGLRYEASDQTVRAHDPEIRGMRWPVASPDIVQALRGVLPTMAREVLGELVLHKFTPRELALPQTMGFEPDTVTVVDDGVVVWFKPRPLR